MARPNRLREKIAAGKTCVGPLFQEFWSPELFEFCAMAGFGSTEAAAPSAAPPWS